jgi:hypothetical protein
MSIRHRLKTDFQMLTIRDHLRRDPESLGRDQLGWGAVGNGEPGLDPDHHPLTGRTISSGGDQEFSSRDSARDHDPPPHGGTGIQGLPDLFDRSDQDQVDKRGQETLRCSCQGLVDPLSRDLAAFIKRQRSRPAAASIRRPTALSAARSSARPSVCLFLGIHVHENAMNPSDSFRLLDEEDLKISEEARARHP